MYKGFAFLAIAFAMLVSDLTAVTVLGQSQGPYSYYSYATLEGQVVIEAEATYGQDYFTRSQMIHRQFEFMRDGFERTENGTIIYPDFYGGSYMNQGRMVILIVESGLEQAKRHSSIGPLLEDGVQYRLVEFSYNALRELQHVISYRSVDEVRVTLAERNWRNDWCVYRNNISSIGVMVMDNRVEVRLVHYNEDMVAGFRRYVYDSPMLYLRQGGWLFLGGEPRQATVMTMAVVVSVVIVVAFLLAKALAAIFVVRGIRGY